MMLPIIPISRSNPLPQKKKFSPNALIKGLSQDYLILLQNSWYPLLMWFITALPSKSCVVVPEDAVFAMRASSTALFGRAVWSQIVDSIEKALVQTGYEEIALLSLSSSDYTHLPELVDTMTEKFAGRNITITLPSLRIESFSIDVMGKLRGSRQGGFTLAPEAASDTMRNRINKPISQEMLLDTTNAIYKAGWTSIKLYFMIGQPGETIEDVQAIADLCKAVLQEGRKVIGNKANLHAGVSTFVPKPHTPFQWARLILCHPYLKNKIY